MSLTQAPSTLRRVLLAPLYAFADGGLEALRRSGAYLSDARYGHGSLPSLRVGLSTLVVNLPVLQRRSNIKRSVFVPRRASSTDFGEPRIAAVPERGT